MPFPLLGAAAAAIGAGNLISGIFTNKRNREFSEHMYNVQRQHGLQDWAMQNDYNSPAAQMQRLKDAGLNPNLVYGSGTVAGNSSSPVHEGTVQSAKAEAPQFDAGALSTGLFAPLDMEIKKQQLDNLKTQKTVMESDVLKKTADVANIGVKTERGKFDLSLSQALRENIMETASANLRLIGTRNELGVAQIGKTLTDQDIKREYGFDQAKATLANTKQLNVLRDAANIRAESMNVAQLKIAAQRVINMMQDKSRSFQETIRLQEASRAIRRATTLQDIDIHMRSAGFDWNDPFVLRQLRMSSRGYSK